MTDMQDRINELAKQYGIDVDQDTLCRHGGWDEPVRNFAQAIARECIAAAFDAETDRARGDLSGEAVAQAIRARFGIAAPPGDG